MNNEEKFETIEIPDTLLELQGLRTAYVTLTDDEIGEAVRLERLGSSLVDSRIVEAGISDFFKGMLRKKMSVQEIEAMLTKVQNFAKNHGTSPELKQYTDEMTEFLQNVNKGTGKKFFYGPHKRGMLPGWEEINSLTKRLEDGDAQIKALTAKIQANPSDTAAIQLKQQTESEFQQAYSTLQSALGSAGMNTEDALSRYLIPKFVSNMMKRDQEWLKKTMPGVYKVGDNNVRSNVTVAEFFQNPSNLADVASARPGQMIITDEASINLTLKQMSEDVAASAKIRGIASSLAAIGVGVAALPHAAGIGAAAWGLNQGMNMPISKDELGKIGKPGIHVNPSGRPDDGSNSEKSNGLGGTTNGNNIGGLGGQFSPKSPEQNQSGGWAPQAPNLPNNTRDWLPTNTSDYYNLIKKSNSEDNNGLRFAENSAQAQYADFANIDDVARNVFTILEQGAPGEATFQRALDYIKSEGSKAEVFLKQHAEQNGQFNNLQVQGQQKEKVE